MFPQPTGKSGKLIHTTTDFQIQVLFPIFFSLPSAYHNLLWETLYDLKSPLIFVETQNQRLISQCAVCLSSGSRPVVSKGSRNTHY